MREFLIHFLVGVNLIMYLIEIYPLYIRYYIIKFEGQNFLKKHMILRKLKMWLIVSAIINIVILTLIYLTK